MHVHLHIPGNPAGSAFDPTRESAHRSAAPQLGRARVCAKWAVEEAAARPSESEVTGMTPMGPAVSAPLWEELFMSTGTAVMADPHVVTCTLAPRFDAVRTAREFARSTLHGWGLGELFDDIALVASELVTNALRHALEPRRSEQAAIAPSYLPMQPGPQQSADDRLPIRISLVHRAPQVVCAVSDPSSAGPIAREPDFVAESGRGLHLVDSFSRSWGWHPLAGAGKVVWAMFEAESEATAGMSVGRHRRSA
ncbi:hypothetical protein P3T39_001597 [Kitasatospora sp. GP82]|nr:hypothetical protein [Kitasatospora sp. GP82]